MIGWLVVRKNNASTMKKVDHPAWHLLQTPSSQQGWRQQVDHANDLNSCAVLSHQIAGGDECRFLILVFVEICLWEKCWKHVRSRWSLKPSRSTNTESRQQACIFRIMPVCTWGCFITYRAHPTSCEVMIYVWRQISIWKGVINKSCFWTCWPNILG